MEPFQTEKILKIGPRGSVRVLRHTISGNRYIFRRYQGDGEVYRRLLTLRCPYLPEVFEVRESDGNVDVLEEYVHGDNLADLMQGSLLTGSQVKKVVRQLAQALCVLHGIGAVHRDIKPENVMLRGGDAVLVDFDASRMVKEEADADTRILGTTGYAPPEQYGLGQTDPRSDIYALGVLMNVALTGKHPTKALANGRLGRVVQKCTMMSPDRRYQTALKLMEAL